MISRLKWKFLPYSIKYHYISNTSIKWCFIRIEASSILKHVSEDNPSSRHFLWFLFVKGAVFKTHIWIIFWCYIGKQPCIFSKWVSEEKTTHPELYLAYFRLCPCKSKTNSIGIFFWILLIYFLMATISGSLIGFYRSQHRFKSYPNALAL